MGSRPKTLIVHSFADLAASAKPSSGTKAKSVGEDLHPKAEAQPTPTDAAKAQRLAVRSWLAATWPTAFTWPFRPLAIGAHRAIHAARPESISAKSVYPALYSHTSTLSYLRAVANGERRINLDGTDAGEIDEDEKSAARARIKTYGTPAFGKGRNSKKVEIGMASLTARTLKVMIILDPAQIATVRVSEGARVQLKIAVADRTVTAEVAGKSIKKAQAAIAEAGVDGVAIIIQGKLITGDVIAEAGLTVQVKLAKAEAALTKV
jgi:ProP effector